MTSIGLVAIAIILFIVAVISPHIGRKIQRKTDYEAGWLKRLANWLWNPLAWWAKTTIEFTRKTIVKVTAWGKKTRRNLPF